MSLSSHGILLLEIETQWPSRVMSQFHGTLSIKQSEHTGRDTLFLVHFLFSFNILLPLEFGVGTSSPETHWLLLVMVHYQILDVINY